MNHEEPNYIDPISGEYNGPIFDSHDMQYFKIAALLAVLTAIEIALSYTSLEHFKLAAPLFILAGIKFFVVIGYFMHIKYDNAIFRRLFVLGGLLAAMLYVGIMSAMGVLRSDFILVMPFHWLAVLGFVAVVGIIWLPTWSKKSRS